MSDKNNVFSKNKKKSKKKRKAEDIEKSLSCDDNWETDSVWVIEEPGSDNEKENSISTRMFKESERYKKVKLAAYEFKKLCNPFLKSKKWYKHWESWLWNARYRESNCDAVIPDGENCTSNESLKQKLILAGASPSESSNICRKLGYFCTKQSLLLSSMTIPAQVAITFRCCRSDDKMMLEYNSVSVEINLWHYNKLHLMYKTHNGNSTRFKEYVFMLLVRYYSVQGVQPQGGGNQAAIPSRCMKVLIRCMNVSMECFASPLNCYFNGNYDDDTSETCTSRKASGENTVLKYCSLFYDTDCAFGSLGPFSDFQGLEGSFQANPPFEASCVREMYNHMFSLLENASGRNLALQFIVVVPHWGQRNMSSLEKDVKSLPSSDPGGTCSNRDDEARISAWTLLTTSPFLTHCIQLPQMAHGFLEGCQHLKSIGKVRQSVIDTDIIMLQTPKAVEKWPITPSHKEALTLSFDMTVPSSRVQAMISEICDLVKSENTTRDSKHSSELTSHVPLERKSAASKRAKRRKLLSVNRN